MKSKALILVVATLFMATMYGTAVAGVITIGVIYLTTMHSDPTFSCMRTWNHESKSGWVGHLISFNH